MCGMIMKRYPLSITITLALLATCNVALSQDIIDRTPLRNQGDAVDWDKISIPPSDPYTLTYLPPRPEGAMNITDEASCLAANGKWLDKRKYNQDFDLYGCTVDHNAEGLWRFVWRKKMPSTTSGTKKKKGAKEEPAITSIPEEALGGYVWFLEGFEEGESVQFEEDAKFMTFLQSYHKGEFDGPVMRWDNKGQLTSYMHYENGKREGTTASFTAAGMPEYYGSYADDKPAGDWYIFNPFFGPLQYIKRYDKPVPLELTTAISNRERLVWVEEYDFMAGKKIKEGFRSEWLTDDPTDSGEMIHVQHFYDTNGGKWLDVHFAVGQVIDDETITKLCQPFKDYSFNHATRTLICLNDDDEEVINIQYYPTNEIRLIERRANTKMNAEDSAYSDDYWYREELHKDGSPLTEPREILVLKTEKYYVPQSPYSFIYSQTDLTENKKQGEMGRSNVINGSGIFTDYWSNGQVRTSGGFFQNKKTGEWSYYTENGAKYRQEQYFQGILNGSVKTWFGDGMPDQVYNYSMGIMDGDQKGYYTLGGLAWEAHHDHGRLVGVYREYTGTGSLKKEVNFDKPVKVHGDTLYPVTLYYSNGKVRATGFDEGISDERNGAWRLFLKTGEFWREVSYSGGVPNTRQAVECQILNGTYVIDEDKLEEGCYLPLVNRESLEQPGKLRHGFWRWWDESGSLQREGTIILGHFYGKWRYFFPGGKPGVEPDENKLMLEGEFDCDRPVGEWRGYYSGRVPKFEGQYDVNGKETGIWTTYYDTGKMSSRGEFKDGKRVGDWEWGHENGAIREKGRFEDGDEVGTWQSWYPNGSEAGKGDYANGMRTGDWIWKRENGEEWRRTTFIEGRDQSFRNIDSDEDDD